MYRALLKKEESYAIHALVSVADNPGISAAKIAEHFEMPPAFMAKVLRKLTLAKFTVSKMGRSGGIWLNCDPKKTSMLDIIQSISGFVILDNCESEVSCISKTKNGRCLLNDNYTQASIKIRQILGSIMLSDLIDDE